MPTTPQGKFRYMSASSLLFAARIGGAAAMFGAQVVLARTTPAESLAVFFMATSLVTVAGTVASLGYSYVVAAYLGRYQAPRHAPYARAFLKVSRNDALMTGALFALVLAAGIMAYPHISLAERISFLVALPAIPAIALSRTNGAIGRARAKLAAAYLPTILWRPVFFLALSAIAALIFHRTDAAAFAGLFAAVAVVSAATQGYGLRDKTATAMPKTDKRLTRLWRRAATPFIAISMVEILIVDLDLLLNGALLTRKELAIFAVCLKLAFFAGFIVDVLHDLMSPELARCYARRDIAAMQKNISMSNLLAAGCTLGMLAGAVLLGRFALGFFGPDYVAGYPVLLTLVAVQVANAFGGPHVALLTLKGAQRRLNMAYAAGGIVLVTFSIALTHLFGMLGAALAVFAAFATLNLILAFSVWHMMGLRSDVWNLARMFAAWRMPRAAL
jgi:O-antigen/teichoic acid export membrane protein